MKKNLVTAFPVVLVALTFAVVAFSQAPAGGTVPTKVATIQVQAAILSTTDGKKAQNDLTAKFNPRKQALEKKQSDIVNLQDQLRKGSATMSEDAKNKLMRDIDSNQTSLKRDSEDFDSDLQQEEGKIMNDLGQKIMDVIIKYATQNGIAMVVDVSNPQTPVLWGDPAVDITQQVIKNYDAAHPGGAAAAAPPPAKPPAAAPPKQAPLVAPPASKK